MSRGGNGGAPGPINAVAFAKFRFTLERFNSSTFQRWARQRPKNHKKFSLNPVEGIK